MKTAHLFVIGELERLESETILRLPVATRVAALQDQVGAVFDDAKAAGYLHLLVPRIK